MTSVNTVSNVLWQTVPERRTGSSERSVDNSPTMSPRNVELQRRRGPQTQSVESSKCPGKKGNLATLSGEQAVQYHVDGPQLFLLM